MAQKGPKRKINRKRKSEEADSDDSLPEVAPNQPSPISEELMPKLPPVIIIFFTIKTDNVFIMLT